VDGEEELAGPSRLPPLMKWVVGGGVLAALVIIGAQLAGGAGFGADRAPVRPAPSESAGPHIAQWPSAEGACGSGLLPIVSSVPMPPNATGVRVLLGGDQLRQVDLDTGAVTVVPGVDPKSGQSVTQLRGASPTYAVLSGCDPLTSLGLVRIGAGAPTDVPTMGLLRNVISATGQGRAWAVLGGGNTIPGTLRSLDDANTVQTPRGFTPLGVIGSHYVGEQLQIGPLAGEDLPTVQIRDLRDGDDTSDRLGRGQVIAVTRTGVLWLPPCAVRARHSCMLTFQPLAPPGAPRSFRLPPGRVPTARGVVSPDGQQVAFTLQRGASDVRYPFDAAPTDVAIFATSSGSITIVPGVELPTAPVPGMAFSEHGWLILALNNGPTTRLLAWRLGLARPLESPVVHAVATGRPPLVVLPNGA
jgi:hypothetical protein